MRTVKSQKCLTGDILLYQGRFGKTVPLNPGKYNILPVLFLFLYPFLTTIKLSDSNKNYFPEIINTRAIMSEFYFAIFKTRLWL